MNSKHHHKEATLFAFASIIFIEQIFRVMQGNIDVIILGTVSHEAVAAVGVVNQIIAICLVIISVGSIGTNILLAQYAGERNDRKILSSLCSGLSITLMLSAVLFIIVFFFHPLLLKWMGLTDALIKYGAIYASIVSFSLFLHAFNMIFLVYLRNMQMKKVIIGTLLFATAFNITCTLICLQLFSTTEAIVTAVATLTVIAHFITFLIYYYVLRVRRSLPLAIRSERIYVREITRTGVPSALEHFSYIVFQLLLSWIIIRWGTDQLTAKTYVQAWTEFIFLFSMTIGQATQILLGQKIGQNRLAELPVIVKRSVRINMFIVFCASVILLFIREPLFHFFQIDAHIAKYMYYLFILTIMLEPLRAINVNLVSSLYAIRDTRFPMLISVMSLWLLLAPIVLIFQSVLSIVFIWILMILDELLRATLLSIRWKRQMREIVLRREGSQS